MKSKTIKLILRNKLKNFVTSIDDRVVRDLVKRDAIITGGAIVSMLMKENVNDFDIYFRTKETTKAVAEYYIKKAAGVTHLGKNDYQVHEDEHGRIQITIGDKNKPIFDESVNANGGEQQLTDEEALELGDSIAAKTLEDEADEKEKYKVLYISRNAITLSTKVQLIIRFYGEPDEIHKNYDYVHCTSYWTSWDNELILRKEALESILSKELRYVGSLYPICSIVRLRKFLAKGWTINAGQIMKMCWQISKLNLSDIKVLEDQMIGVDSAFFLGLIQRLQHKDPIKVDESYLMTLIDKIFS